MIVSPPVFWWYACSRRSVSTPAILDAVSPSSPSPPSLQGDKTVQDNAFSFSDGGPSVQVGRWQQRRQHGLAWFF